MTSRNQDILFENKGPLTANNPSWYRELAKRWLPEPCHCPYTIDIQGRRYIKDGHRGSIRGPSPSRFGSPETLRLAPVTAFAPNDCAMRLATMWYPLAGEVTIPGLATRLSACTQHASNRIRIWSYKVRQREPSVLPASKHVKFSAQAHFEDAHMIEKQPCWSTGPFLLHVQCTTIFQELQHENTRRFWKQEISFQDALLFDFMPPC